MNIKELKELANDQQAEILTQLKENKIKLEVKTSEIKSLPITFIMAMGELITSGAMVLIETSTQSIGTIGSLSSAELVGTTNANRNIDWAKVNETINNSLTGVKSEHQKSVHEGLVRTFNKSLTAIGAKVLLKSLETGNTLEVLKECIGVDTMENTSSKLIKLLKENLTIKL